MRSTLGTFAPRTLLYFVTREDGEEPVRARRLINWAAKHSYCIALAVSLGNIRTLIEAPGIMTHAALPLKAHRQGRIPQRQLAAWGLSCEVIAPSLTLRSRWAPSGSEPAR